MTTDEKADPTIPLKAVYAYLRVSTDRQAQADLSLPDQEEAIRRYAKAGGFFVSKVFSDSISGTRADRPGLMAMMAAALSSSERPEAILIHSQSRLFRDAYEFEGLRRELLRAKIKIISVTQDYGDTEQADLMRGISSLFDQYNSAETAKHVRRTMIRNAEQGYWNGAEPPFGYRTVGIEKKGAREKKILAVDSVEADIVRQIFELKVYGLGSQTMGVKAIVEHLNKSGIKTRRGGLWGVGAVNALLKRPSYIGQHVYNRTDSKRKVARPENEHVIVEVPAIIDVELFNTANALMRAANPKTGRPKAVTGPVLLTELAHCSLCGSSMTLTTGTGKSGSVYRYYKCAGKVRAGSLKCTGVSIPVQKLDNIVMDAFRTAILDPDRIIQLLSALKIKHASESEALRRRVTDLVTIRDDAVRRLTNLYDGIAKGVLDIGDPTLKSLISSATESRNNAEEALSRIRSEEKADGAFSDAEIFRFTSAIRDALNDGDINFRKSWLRALICNVNVSKSEVTILGSTDALKDAVEDSGKKSDGVRAYEPKWRTRQDSNL